MTLNNFPDCTKPRSIFKITHISHAPQHLKDLGVQGEPSRSLSRHDSNISGKCQQLYSNACLRV